MKAWAKAVIIAVGLFGAYEGCVIAHEYGLRGRYYREALQEAKRRRKPLLIAGRPKNVWGAAHPCGDVCIDIVGCPECPVWVQGDISNMYMFEDKQFGAAYCSHVLEHISQPWIALKELRRVADTIFILYPPSIHIVTSLYPGHKVQSLRWLWMNLGGRGVYIEYD